MVEYDGAETITLEFQLESMDFMRAGEASSEIKQRLKKLGFQPEVTRRVAIAAYEAEMNVIIHAHNGGTMKATISPRLVELTVTDFGPGIADVSLAMQEGWSTATEQIRELGFGAGMGLPNIRRCADDFAIESEVGQGTVLRIVVNTGEG